MSLGQEKRPRRPPEPPAAARPPSVAAAAGGLKREGSTESCRGLCRKTGTTPNHLHRPSLTKACDTLVDGVTNPCYCWPCLYGQEITCMVETNNHEGLTSLGGSHQTALIKQGGDFPCAEIKKRQEGGRETHTTLRVVGLRLPPGSIGSHLDTLRRGCTVAGCLPSRQATTASHADL